jgi:hypothetical protein
VSPFANPLPFLGGEAAGFEDVKRIRIDKQKSKRKKAEGVFAYG